MDVRYEGTRTNEPDLIVKDLTAEISSTTNFMGRLTTLLLWHQQDPVDDAERLRNDLIFELYQKNRNPFVDNPECVQEIFQPAMRVELAGDDVLVFWPSEFPEADLLVATNAVGPWIVGSGPREAGNEIRQTEAISAGRHFFRLQIY